MVQHGQGISSVAFDLGRLHQRTLSSFYSNLVTRPTGRAIRMGVESQLAELAPTPHARLSVLDFAQVRVVDYSCADEIVAKLLLRYVGPERPSESFFVVRGLQDHHREAVEAVLEHHGLLLAAETADGQPVLLGPSDPVERACWAAVVRLGCVSVESTMQETGLAELAAATGLETLVRRRVALRVSDLLVCGLTQLSHV